MFAVGRTLDRAINADEGEPGSWIQRQKPWAAQLLEGLGSAGRSPLTRDPSTCL